MNKNLDLVAEELFGKIRTQFPKITLRDAESNPTEEEKLARFFQFDYVVNGKNLGSISISISEKDGFVVTYSNDIVENQPDGIKRNWFNFLRELREFSKQKTLKFETRDIAKSNLDKRDYNYLSKQYGESKMTESKLWGTNKTSYQDLGETRIIIKHSQPVNYDLPAGRTMHIESIYIENAAGERFRYPHRHLNGARAMAEHIAHGGNPYDDIGQHVVGLSEELSSLRKFKNYVSRTPVVSESMGPVAERVIERIEEIKKEVQSLQRRSYYESFAESFTKSEEQSIPEDIVNDWIDRLTIRTFNEELKSVFPYIYRLVGEEAAPIKELAADDLLSGSYFEEDNSSEEESAALELENFESYLNNIIGEGTDIFSNNEESANAAIEKLNGLVAQEFPVGTDGSNAIESLQDIINDDELTDVFKELADINPESDVRSILKDYIKIKDEENGSDISSKINFPDSDGGTEPAPAAPAPEPAMPPAAAPAPEPAPAAPAAAPAAAPVMASLTHESDNKQGLKSAIEKAKKAGLQAEDTITMFGEEVTLASIIKRAGMQVNEFFDNEPQETNEIAEFVQSMFDSETGKFPKGETGVLLSVQKKFGEGAVNHATQLMNELMNQVELERIQELAGAPKPSMPSAPPAPSMQKQTKPSLPGKPTSAQQATEPNVPPTDKVQRAPEPQKKQDPFDRSKDLMASLSDLKKMAGIG